MSIPDLTSRLEHADDIVREGFGDNPPPGFALGVVDESVPVLESHYGYADLETRQPITSNTVFRIGSISKTFTAIAVMQLWERGCFELNDPINDYLKAFGLHPPNSDAPAITIHHLLSHTSGLGRGETFREFVDVYGHFSGRWKSRFRSLNEFYGPQGLHPMIPAGEKYSYSNNGYAILGQLIEDVSGLSFADYMRQQVFDSLGMTASDVVMRGGVGRALAGGYRGRSGQYVPIRPTEILQQGAGALLCSLKDLMSFVIALIRQDERLLRTETWQLMQQPHWQLDPRLWAEAYGVQFYTLEEHKIYNQSGGAGGFNANITFSPDHQLGIVTLSNRTLTIETYRIAKALMRHLLDARPAISEADRHASSPRLSKNQLESFTGYYAPSPGWKINIDFYTDFGFAGVTIAIEDGLLRMHTDLGRLADGIHLYPDADDPYLFHGQLGGWCPFIFHRSARGQIDGLLFDFHHHLHRHPLTTSLKHRLRYVMGWSLATIILLGVLLHRMRKSRY
ncbi:MAG: hypothetical protein CL607_22930 [Anaerolineaceae bacterium]|nr:hypothetical protein [Anaerolineaceae bacterium]